MKNTLRNFIVLSLIIVLVILLPVLANAETVQGEAVASGNLNVKDIKCEYTAGPDGYNEGSVGSMSVLFTVTGPAEVADVLIASFGTAKPDESGIMEEAQGYADMWKTQVPASDEIPPYTSGGSFPVFKDDIGKTLYVLMVGLDNKIDAVGYVIIKLTVPGEAAPSATPINSVAITVTPPAAGTTSETKPNVTVPNDAHYSLEMAKWIDENYNEDLPTFTFAAGQTYRLFATLKADDGYDFTDTATATITGGQQDGALDIYNNSSSGYSGLVAVITIKIEEATVPQQPTEQETPPVVQPQEQPTSSEEVKTEIPASIDLSKTSLTFKNGSAQTVTVTLANPEDSIASVKSSKTKVAKVKFKGTELEITPAKEAGKATITITSAKGATAKVEVTVKASVSLNEKKVELKKGKTFKVKVVSIPAGVKAKSFKSDKPAVATVDAKGKVKAVMKGKATITVTLTNGKTLKLKVTVK